MSKTKKRIIALAVVVVVLAGLILGMFAGMSLKATAKGNLLGTPKELSPIVEREFKEDPNAPEGFKVAYTNENLTMYINEEDCNVAIKDESTGMIWSTMPLNIESEGKARLNSQLYIQYYNEDSLEYRMDSYNESVKVGQYEIVPIEKGIRITYVIGTKKITLNMLPVAINKERFENVVLKGLEGKDELRDELLKEYKLTKISDLSKYLQGVYAKDYPSLDVNKEYYLLSNTCAPSKYVSIYNILFEEAGYTEDDFNADNKENGIKIEFSEPAQFTIPVEFMIENGEFVSRVVTSKIKSPSRFTLTHITLNEFFGAGSTSDNGYIVMPDGSGALVNFNNGKTSTTSYSLDVYGEDASYKTKEGKDDETPSVLAPVFGIKKNDAAFLAVIEEGETHATISADISGKTHSYNHAYAKFNVRPLDTMSVETSDKKIRYSNRYQGGMYQGDCIVRYLFTDKENASYVGMAKLYKDYLTSKGELLKKDTSNVPFVLELLGQATVKKSVLGVPVTSQESLTTFQEAAEIMKLLYDGGVKNSSVKYSAWAEGAGLYQSAASDVSISGEIGGKTDLADLNAVGTTYGASVYLNSPINNVYASAPNFNQWSYANRLTYNQIANQRFYDVATYQQVRDKYYTISTRFLGDYVNKFLSRTDKIGAENIWFNDLASDLNSDFRKNSVVDRQVAKDYVVDALKAASDKTGNLGLDSPNVYAWKYADEIVNLPLNSSGNRMIDEEIPFIPIVLSGTVSYTGKVINTSGQDRHELLKAIETGAGLHFKWIYSDNDEVMEMEGYEASELYSLYYGDWINTATDYYKQLNEKAAGLIGSEIIGHEKIEYNVYKTTYSAGSVIVNYNDYEVTVGEVTVGAKDFEVIK